MRLATLDLETDPFTHGKIPQPFVAGFYDGEEYIQIWSPDCCARMVDALNANSKGPFVIYAHNGGRFDFFYFLKYLSQDLRIINGRIVAGHIGRHEIRDSYAILPFPLREFDKDEIDYEKMRVGVREKHREEITRYLRKDCTSLYELVSTFVAEFGDNLTVGSSALKQLKKRHKFLTGGPILDRIFRDDFYFGGRVECFRSGIIRQPIQVYDVNSMYPYVMSAYLHPAGNAPIIEHRIRPNTCFVVVEGHNDGALPSRDENGGLTFTRESGIFHTSIHEFNAALETGSFRPTKILKTYGFTDRITFQEFVYHFYGQRKLAKFRHDKIHELFYKYVLNSAYGKFAQNPVNFCDYEITSVDEVMPHPCAHGLTGCECKCGGCWHMEYEHNDYIIWSKATPESKRRYYNICIGASITGAARAVLLRGIHNAITPLYCDTDSIICESMRDASIDASELGAWKLEVTGNIAAICGKKMYAIYDQDRSTYEPLAKNETPCKIEGRPTMCVKKANKGALLTPGEIWRIVKGETITTINQVPTFKLDGQHVFQTRKIRRTA